MKMRIGWKTLAVAGVLATASWMSASKTAIGQGVVESDSFLPPNDLRIPVRVGADANKGINEAEFNAVLDQLQELYAPIMKTHGARLVIERNWTDDTVNAYAYRSGSDWYIAMYGGLARHEVVTQDGFALVACHEIGHHLGGPKSGSWAANEGQSDYYGTAKCMRHLFARPGAASFTRLAVNEDVAAQACAGPFANATEKAMCVRGAMAGVSLGTLLNVLGGGSPTPRLETPDMSKVDRTNDRHPAAQCRMDTYFQGALCSKPVSEDINDRDYAKGACTRSQGHTIGVRPRCWFKPPAGEPELIDVALRSEVKKHKTPAPALLPALSQSDLWQGL